MSNSIEYFIIGFLEFYSLMLILQTFFHVDLTIRQKIYVLLLNIATTALFVITQFKSIVLINYLIVFFGHKLISKKNYKRVLFELMSVLSIGMLSQMLTILLIKNVIGIYEKKFETDLIIITINILFFLNFRGLHRLVKSFLSHFDGRYLAYFGVNIGSFFLLMKFLWEKSHTIIVDYLVIVTTIFILIIFSNFLLHKYIIKIIGDKKSLETQSKFMPILDEYMGEVRRTQHDFKNYLNGIQGIVEVVPEEDLKYELKNYIHSVCSKTSTMEELLYVKRTILRAILYIKTIEAEQQDIKFNFDIDNMVANDLFTDVEMTDIINNLMTNGFEALKQVEKDQRQLSLKIYEEGKEKIIETKNTVNIYENFQLDKIFEKGFSTKEGDKRGFGLYNIKKIVEKNNGKVLVYLEDNMMNFRISIKNKPTQGQQILKTLFQK